MPSFSRLLRSFVHTPVHRLTKAEITKFRDLDLFDDEIFDATSSELLQFEKEVIHGLNT